MKNKRHWLLAILAAGWLAGAARPARAQDRSDVSDRTAPNELKGDTYIGAQIGVDFIGDTNYKCRCDARQSDFLLYGGRFGHYFSDHFALEATVNWIDLHPGFYDASLGFLFDFTPTQHGWNTYLGLGGGSEREHVRGRGEGLAYLAVGSEYRFNRAVGARFELRSSARIAIRGVGILPASETSAVRASGPDTRTMEMALGGRPDDSAKIVCSRGCIAYLPQSPLKRQRNFYWPGGRKRPRQGDK